MQNQLFRIASLLVNGEEYSSDELRQIPQDIADLGKGKYHLLLENQSYDIELIDVDIDAKKVDLKVEGEFFSISVHNGLDTLVHELGFDQMNLVHEKEIVAPMPGLVLDILVKEGQEVEAGEDLIILEAMKMENVLQAPNAGTVQKIEVAKSEAVEKRQILIVFE